MSNITELDQLISRIQYCTTDFKTRMIYNKLQLNDDKTELMLAPPGTFHNHPSHPPSTQINQVDISFSPSVRSLKFRSRPNIIFQAACLQHLQSSIPGAPQNQYYLKLPFC